MRTPHEIYTDNVDQGSWPNVTEVPLGSAFVDERGVIQNLLLKPMTSLALIRSARGSVRANHYHKTDWHYAYVLSGSILYFERDIGSSDVPDPVVFRPGQMFFTPPMKEHAMVFAEDTLFLTMAKNERSHDNHEADLERVLFISPERARELSDSFVTGGTVNG